MALAEMQAVLARLYTDKAYREAFFADVVSSCDELELTDAERRSLAGLDRKALEMYARSLIGKRIEAVKPLIPAAAAVLAQGLRMWFERYCDSSPPSDDPLDDASRFLHFLKEKGPSEPDYLTELLWAEAIRIGLLSIPQREEEIHEYKITARAIPKLSPRARVSQFEIDIPAIHASLLRGSQPADTHDPCSVLFALRADGSVHLRRLNPSAADLIECFDGLRRWGEIMVKMVGQLGIGLEMRSAFEAECRTFLVSLLDSGLAELV